MLKDIRRYGAVKQEALSALHARRSQPITLGVGFNTLGNYVQIQAVRHLNNGLYQAAILRQPIHKGFVDFEDVHRQRFHVLELTQAGIPHTKIVQRNADPGITQRFQNGDSVVRIVDTTALGDFQDQRVGLNAVAVDQLEHLRHHGRVHQL